MRNRYTSDDVLGFQQMLVRQAGDGQRAEDRGRVLEEQAKAEGYVRATAQIDFSLNHPKGGVAAARAEAFQLLARGADDTWSGRGNDLARADFDGVRQAVQDRMDHDLYEEK